MSQQRVVIVGAGPGGLATAMLCAKAGLDVTVLERLDRPGGRTSALEADGFRFDTGPTFFLYPRVLEGIYRATGHDLRQQVPMVRLDPQYHLVYGQGGELLCSPQPDRMEAAVAKLDPHDAANLRRFLEDNRGKLEAFRPALESPWNSWWDLLRPETLKLLPWLKPWRSLDRELRDYFRDERTRLAFAFQSKYLGMSPFRCPSLFSILSFLEYEHGVHHPIGGCAAVSENMAELVEELGGKIHYEEPVTEVLFDGRRAVGVRTAKADYGADALVINADFARAMERLVPDEIRKGWRDKKLRKKRYSCSTFMLYLGIEGSYDHLQHHTIYLSKNYAQNLRDIERDHVLSEDPSFYVQNACRTDPSLAPPGSSTLYVLVPVTHQHPNVDWNRAGPGFRKRVLAQLSKVGLDDVEERIRYERVITPQDWDVDYEIYRGATFNLAHNLRQMLHLRPRNRFAELEGVYLTGGGTHPGSGLPVIYESARISSKLLLQDLRLDDAFIDEAREPRAVALPPQPRAYASARSA